MKCQKLAKNAHPHFPELSVTSSDFFFFPNNTLKHKDSSLFFINNTEKQQILTLTRLNQHFLLFLMDF